MPELFTFLSLFATSNFKPLPFIQIRRYRHILYHKYSLEYANNFCKPASLGDLYFLSYKLSKIFGRKKSFFGVFWPISDSVQKSKYISNLSDSETHLQTFFDICCKPHLVAGLRLASACFLKFLPLGFSLEKYKFFAIYGKSKGLEDLKLTKFDFSSNFRSGNTQF